MASANAASWTEETFIAPEDFNGFWELEEQVTGQIGPALAAAAESALAAANAFGAFGESVGALEFSLNNETLHAAAADHTHTYGYPYGTSHTHQQPYGSGNHWTASPHTHGYGDHVHAVGPGTAAPAQAIEWRNGTLHTVLADGTVVEQPVTFTIVGGVIVETRYGHMPVPAPAPAVQPRAPHRRAMDLSGAD